MAKPTRLSSPHPRSVCVARLQEAVDGPLVMFGKKPVVGSVGDHKATLRKRIRGRNSFQTALRVNLADISTGTAIDCRGGMHPAVVVFMTLWLGAVIVVGGAVFLASVIALTGAAQSEIPPAIGLLVPPSFLLFGLLLLTLGRRMARGEEAFLVAFLAQTTQARVLADDRATTGTVT